MYYVDKNFKHEFYLVEKNVNYIWRNRFSHSMLMRLHLGICFARQSRNSYEC